MHAQIKAVIASIRAIRDGQVAIDFSCGQHTALGFVLADMYYKTDLTALLDSTQMSGYPHNGGSHTFRLTCAPIDAIAYIEQMKETLESKRTYNDEHRQVISELSYISQELHAFRRRVKQVPA